MDTFLPPIEKPKGLMMKLAYYFTRRQFGKEHYRTSALFTDAERAALDYVTELTKDKKISQDTFARVSRYYSERAICEIVWLVASEHMYNMINIGLNIHSDMLCDISRKKQN
jgi:alkylhydroperoxidase family enzyme